MSNDKIFQKAHLIKLDINFSNGFHTASGKGEGTIELAKNGNEKPVLRGTSIAGVVRNAMRNYENIFGKANAEKETKVGSRIKFYDTVLSDEQEETTHNAVSRHTGSVKEHSLFSMEKLVKDAKGTLIIELKEFGDTETDYADFLSELLSVLHDKPIMGGGAARGIGVMDITGSGYKRFDLSKIDEYGKYLDTIYAVNGGDHSGISDPLPSFSKGTGTKDKIAYKLIINIARGQDILVSTGNAMEQMQSGNCWVIPGSTLRGLFRSYMTRLAIKEGRSVLDSLKKYRDNDFKELEPKEYENDGNCVICELFGSTEKKGRIHISNAYGEKKGNNQIQKRTHVAIDRFTGAAIDSALFENEVLTDSSITFVSDIFIETPVDKDEEKWLEQTVNALDSGIIRIGSSKASGRVNAKLVRS